MPQKIIVAGKIDNYDPSREVVLAVNRAGFMQESIQVKTDSTGSFTTTFESYIPTDAYLVYKANFLILLHLGDSLFVHFDGQYNDRQEILNTIKFGGNVAQTNQYAAKFQQMYFSNELFHDWDKKDRAVRNYDVEQYIQYLDTVQQKSKELYDQFVSENNPNAESRKWAQLILEENHNHQLASYASGHRRANNMQPAWDVPLGFYDKLCNSLPINHSMFIASSALNTFINVFDRYISNKLKYSETDITTVVDKDSIRIFSAIEFVSDPLLLQLMLTMGFDMDFLFKQNINNYERFHDVVNKYIKEPFLREPLQKKYLQTKLMLESPQIYTETILKEAANLSINWLVDEIFQQNKDKVIYVDFWATWCAPCLAEFPNSKEVEHEFKDTDVVFVYLCLESEENQWKATIDKFQLGGQHYHLSYKQSTEIRNLFDVRGVPEYLLIDKSGVIKEKGTHLRPLVVKDKINEILK